MGKRTWGRLSWERLPKKELRLLCFPAWGRFYLEGREVKCEKEQWEAQRVQREQWGWAPG